MTMVAGVVASLMAFGTVRYWDREHARHHFEEVAVQLAAAIDQAIDETMAVLRAQASYYQIRGRIDRQQFFALVNEAPGRRASILALDWVPRVRSSERARYEAAARAEGLAGFEFLERTVRGDLQRAGARDEYFPVYYSHSSRPRQPPFGFDVGSEATREAAIDSARRSGRLHATAPVKLTGQPAGQAGILVFAPVYRRGAPVATDAERHDGVWGFVVAVLHVPALVDGVVARSHADGIAIEVSDDAASTGERLLHRRGAGGGPGPGLAANLSWQTTLPVAGRRWTISFRPTGSYPAQRAWMSWAALVLGLVFTAVITFSVGVTVQRAAVLGRAKKRLETEIDERERAHRALRDSERRYRLLADNAKDVISVFDLDLTPRYMSPSVLELRGFSVDEAIHQTVSERLTPASAELTRQVLGDALAAEDAGTRVEWPPLELELRCKNGSTVWVEATASFLRDDAGRPAGILSVARDITARRRTADRVRALAEVGRALSQSLDPELTGRLVIESVCTLLDAKSAGIYRIDVESGTLVLDVSVTGGDLYWSDRLPQGHGLSGVAVRERRSAAAIDVLRDPRIE
jgi:PAS domain S-box-containing protein